MSGIEFIVGTVLASVPIALEAYDRSGRVFEIFSAFKQYPREVVILETKLGAQRTIFRNNAINLLTTITKDRAKVQEVINQPSLHVARPSLVMASVYQHRMDALDESFVTCRQTAEQIQNTLQLLYAQSDAFRAEVGERQDEKMGASDWLKHVRTRFKLGLSKPQIGKAIEELRGFNRDFGLITEQITKALQEILNEHQDNTGLVRKSAKGLNTLQSYHRVRYASKALYSTLQVKWKCSSHHRHSFDVRILNPDVGKGKAKASVAQYITCELAITHDGSSYASKEPLRLEVEQACGSDCEDATPQQAVQDNKNMQQLTTLLESNAGQPKPALPTTTKSKVRGFFKGFRKARQQQPGPSASAPQLPDLTPCLANLYIDSPDTMTATTGSTSDLSLVNEFCKEFHEAATDCIGRSLLASWKGPSAQWFCTPAALGTSQSLADLIRWIAEEPILRSLPRPLLVELAGNVAEGIMQFYSTPWLVVADLGQNVRYFSPTESSTTAVQLRGPYFTARLESKRAKGQMYRSSTDAAASDYHSTGTADYTEARNKLLFNFGVLLLEIGYGRPWHELKQNVAKMTTAKGGKVSDYQAAEKLAQLLVNQMGLTYPKIIRKCLGCDFGLGETDLDNEDLQRRFQEDVVSGLQQLREHMREMNLALLG